MARLSMASSVGAWRTTLTLGSYDALPLAARVASSLDSVRNLLILVAALTCVLVVFAVSGGPPTAPGLGPGTWDELPPPPLRPGVTAVSFERLAAFQYGDTIPRRSGHIPPSVRQLDGQRVRVRGHLVATEQDDDGAVVAFALSRTSPDCCFGRMPRLNEWIRVDAQGARVPRREARQKIYVTGTLQVGEVKDEQSGNVVAIYQLSAEAVE